MTKPHLKLLAAAIAAVFITACGGGSGDDDAASNTPAPDNGQAVATDTTDTATGTGSVTGTTDTGSATVDVDATDTTDTASDTGAAVAEPFAAVVASINGSSTSTALKAGQSNTVVIELQSQDGQPLTGERKVRLEIVEAADIEKAAFPGSGKTLDTTFTNGTGYIAIVPDSGEASITLRLTDRSSGNSTTISLAVETSAATNTGGGNTTGGNTTVSMTVEGSTGPIEILATPVIDAPTCSQTLHGMWVNGICYHTEEGADSPFLVGTALGSQICPNLSNSTQTCAFNSYTSMCGCRSNTTEAGICAVFGGPNCNNNAAESPFPSDGTQLLIPVPCTLNGCPTDLQDYRENYRDL